MENLTAFLIPCIIVWTLGFVYWQCGWTEVRTSAGCMLLGGVIATSGPATESLSSQVCKVTRAVTADEQERIDTATRFLCAVQHASPVELADPVCALLTSGNIQFVTNTYLPPIALRHSCSLGETTPRPKPSLTEDGPIRAAHIALRRDRLPSLAKTFLALAHEGTHATSTPLPYHFVADRYRDERCRDENAVRDKVVVWGSLAVKFLRAIPDVPPPWLADATGMAFPSENASGNWPQRREALISEIELTIRQEPNDADNAHQE